MSELDQIRENINSIDEQMAQLFQKRMEMSARVADFKKERGLSIRDAERERELIDRNRRSIRDPAVAAYYVQFLRGILDLSCAYQSKLLNGHSLVFLMPDKSRCASFDTRTSEAIWRRGACFRRRSSSPTPTLPQPTGRWSWERRTAWCCRWRTAMPVR